MAIDIFWYVAAVPFILLLDHLFRDPVHILGFPHPVILIGRGIAALERYVYRPNRPPFLQTIVGALAVMFVLSVAIIVSVLSVQFAQSLTTSLWVDFVYWLISIFLAAWLIAARGLYDHVAAVQQSVEDNNLQVAREGLLNLAGRNADQLSEAAVLRTAGESLAENFSDAVVAPLTFFVLFGLPGILIYKVINTFDSMWGYRSPRFLYFGRFAARLDDVANYFPARLSALLLLCAGVFSRRSGYWAALAIVWRDAPTHPSPNAGYPESAMAGLSGLRFGGPREYAGGISETTWLGDGREEWRAEDLAFCLGLYRCGILVLCACSGLFVFGVSTYG